MPRSLAAAWGNCARRVGSLRKFSCAFCLAAGPSRPTRAHEERLKLESAPVVAPSRICFSFNAAVPARPSDGFGFDCFLLYGSGFSRLVVL